MFSLDSYQLLENSKTLSQEVLQTGKTDSVKERQCAQSIQFNFPSYHFNGNIFFFPNAFYGLLPRRICEINPMGLGKVPSCIRFPPHKSGYLLVQLICYVVLRSHFPQLPKFMLPCLSFGLFHSLNQHRINLPHLSFLPGFDICLLWTLHILPSWSKSHAFALQHY